MWVADVSVQSCVSVEYLTQVNSDSFDSEEALKWSGEMAQWVTPCLLYKHEDLSLDSQNAYEEAKQYHTHVTPELGRQAEKTT